MAAIGDASSNKKLSEETESKQAADKTPSYMQPVNKTPDPSRRRSRKGTPKGKSAEELDAIKEALAERKVHMKDLFLQYTKQKKLMDGRTFTQFAKNAGLMKKRGKIQGLTRTDLDLAHTKAKKKGQKGINFVEFQRALVDCADRSKTTIQEILEVVDKAPKPTFKGTHGASRFHDNPEEYTGTFAHGGPPTTNDRKTNVFDISQTCNRKPADVRGITKQLNDL